MVAATQSCLLYTCDSPWVQSKGSARGLVDSWFVCSCCECEGVVADDGLELCRGQPPEGALPTSVVVGRLDPGNDCAAELVTVVPRLTVEHVVVQQREERFHRRVVPC